jgi:hypothetical protein
MGRARLGMGSRRKKRFGVYMEHMQVVRVTNSAAPLAKKKPTAGILRCGISSYQEPTAS